MPQACAIALFGVSAKQGPKGPVVEAMPTLTTWLALLDEVTITSHRQAIVRLALPIRIAQVGHRAEGRRISLAHWWACQLLPSALVSFAIRSSRRRWSCRTRSETHRRCRHRSGRSSSCSRSMLRRRECLARPGGAILRRTRGRLRAVVLALIIVVVVAVIASLFARFNNPVTAARRHAVIQAAIRLNLVAVIASLDARVHHTIAAACRDAIGEASVRLSAVAVVAGLDPFVHDPIPAAGGLAVVSARVRLKSVSVITSLDVLLDHAVAAAANRQCSGASVCTSLPSSQSSTPARTTESPARCRRLLRQPSVSIALPSSHCSKP